MRVQVYIQEGMCTGVTAPTNGGLGTCTATLAVGTACDPACNAGYLPSGYGPSGSTYCSATGVLTLAQCLTSVWASRNSMPANSNFPLHGAGVYGTLMYTYVGGSKFDASPTRGDFYKYSGSTDLWLAGASSSARPVCLSVLAGYRTILSGFWSAVNKCPDAKLFHAAAATVGAYMYFLSGDEGPPVPAYPTVTTK